MPENQLSGMMRKDNLIFEGAEEKVGPLSGFVLSRRDSRDRERLGFPTFSHICRAPGILLVRTLLNVLSADGYCSRRLAL